MATASDLLARKGTEVVSIAPSVPVLDAARLMNERGVGGLLVLEDGRRLVGVFTERDILRRVVAAGRDAATTRVDDVMTTEVVSCLPETTVEECAAIMTTRRIRHLPVADAGGLRGVVTSGDVLAYRVAEHEATIQQLNRYVFDVR